MSGNKCRKIILLVLFFLLPIQIFSQKKVYGKITNVDGKELAGASVSIKKDLKIIDYTITDSKGNFTFDVNSANDYFIEVNCLGFHKQTFELHTSEKDTVEKNFILQNSHELLQEVIVKVEPPVKLHGDTLIFNAKTLSTGVENVVEELLKNIPGIIIQKNGAISYNDKPIEKVMIEGSDLFNSGYSILTKNMPVQPLEKVEILQSYSNNKLLKGIEDSDKVALNLTLKEGFKNIWFGDLLLGYGNKNRYLMSGNLMNFTKTHKTFFTTSANNSGYDKIGNGSDLLSNNIELETIGLKYRVQAPMSIGINTPNLDEYRVNFNNTKTASVSSIFPVGTYGNLKLLGYIGVDALRGFNTSNTVVDFKNTSFENDESNQSIQRIKNSFFSAVFNYDFSKTKMLQTSSSLNIGKKSFSNDYVFNTTSTREALETKNTYFDQKLTYTYKWNSRNVVLMKARLFTDKLPQEYRINEYLLGSLFTTENIDAIGSTNNNSKLYAGWEADFRLKQKNGDLLNLAIGYENNRDELSTRFTLFANNEIINPLGYQSNVFYNIADFYVKGGYLFKFAKFAINTNLETHKIFNRYENASKLYNDLFFINPVVKITWEIKPDNKVTFNYNYKSTTSTMLQLADAYILSSSRNFSRGLGDFNQFERSNVGTNFTTNHYLNRYLFSVAVNYSDEFKALAYNSSLNQNTTISNAILVNGGKRLEFRFSSHYVFKKLNGTMRFDIKSNRVTYFNKINNSDLRKNISYNQLYKLSWNSSFKSAFNFSFLTEWNFSKIKSENQFHNNSTYSSLDIKYVVNKNFDFKLKTEHYNFGNLEKFNNYYFADFESSYSLNKGKYVLGLDGRNLLNTTTFTTINISDIGFGSNSYRLLPRYLLATFKFRF